MNSMNEIDWADMALKVGVAIAILIVTWVLAKVVKTVFAKLATRVPALQRAGSGGETLGHSLGTIASLLVWLFGLIAILQIFELDQVLTPIQTLLDSVMGFLPNIVAAGFVFFVGALLAKIVRQLIETALSAVPFERWFSSASSRVGAETGTAAPAGGETTAQVPAESTFSAIPRTLATVAYALIMIVVAIAALQILGIKSISAPAEQMLTTIFDTIPAVIGALIVLGIGVMIARFAGDILEQILSGFGVDRALAEVGALPEGKSASPVISKVVQVAIVLFFAVMAAQLLDFPQITSFLSEVLALGGRVLFGGAIIAVGFFVANLLGNAVNGTPGTVVRYATMVLFVAMGLSYMGIADSIIELAFGALVVGGAAAAALAFGLGGRDAAARQLERLSQRGGPESRGGSTTGFTPGG